MEDIDQIPTEYNNAPAQDPGLMKWFLNLEAPIHKIRLEWSGWIQDINSEWVKPDDSESRRLMNDSGIHWCMDTLKTYATTAFQSSNFDREHMNFIMREAYRVVCHGLAAHFEDFGYQKADYDKIATKILHTMQAILLSSRANGNREFLTKTHQITEVKNTNDNDRRGFFNGLSNMFGGNRRNE